MVGYNKLFRDVETNFDNSIVDITGNGIRVTGHMDRAAEAAGQSQLAQASVVRNNQIVNAGHSARAAIALDPMGDCQPYRGPNAPPRAPLPCLDVPGVRSFDGTSVRDNQLWTSDRARFGHDLHRLFCDGRKIDGEELSADHAARLTRHSGSVK